MAQHGTLTAWLADNPRMMGVLWALALIWAETGSAVAQSATGTGGP